MSRLAIRVSHRRKKDAILKALAAGQKPEFRTKVYNRCRLCGKVGGYMRRFDMCRICFRELALKGQIPGVRKSSW